MPLERRAAKSSGRRPIRFWQAFNEWWRAELAASNKRPLAEAITKWYELCADDVWGPSKPTLQQTRVHAKCLRSVDSVRLYFRKYRASKKQGGGGNSDDDEEYDDGDDSSGAEQNSQSQSRSEAIGPCSSVALALDVYDDQDRHPFVKQEPGQGADCSGPVQHPCRLEYSGSGTFAYGLPPPGAPVSRLNPPAPHKPRTSSPVASAIVRTATAGTKKKFVHVATNQQATCVGSRTQPDAAPILSPAEPLQQLPAHLQLFGSHNHPGLAKTEPSIKLEPDLEYDGFRSEDLPTGGNLMPLDGLYVNDEELLEREVKNIMVPGSHASASNATKNYWMMEGASTLGGVLCHSMQSAAAHDAQRQGLKRAMAMLSPRIADELQLLSPRFAACGISNGTNGGPAGSKNPFACGYSPAARERVRKLSEGGAGPKRGRKSSMSDNSSCDTDVDVPASQSQGQNQVQSQNRSQPRKPCMPLPQLPPPHLPQAYPSQPYLHPPYPFGLPFKQPLPHGPLALSRPSLPHQQNPVKLQQQERLGEQQLQRQYQQQPQRRQHQALAHPSLVGLPPQFQERSQRHCDTKRQPPHPQHRQQQQQRQEALLQLPQQRPQPPLLQHPYQNLQKPLHHGNSRRSGTSQQLQAQNRRMSFTSSQQPPLSALLNQNHSNSSGSTAAVAAAAVAVAAVSSAAALAPVAVSQAALPCVPSISHMHHQQQQQQQRHDLPWSGGISSEVYVVDEDEDGLQLGKADWSFLLGPTPRAELSTTGNANPFANSILSAAAPDSGTAGAGDGMPAGNEATAQDEHVDSRWRGHMPAASAQGYLPDFHSVVTQLNG